MKISFEDAAKELESICNEIDHVEEIDEKLKDSFKDAQSNLSEAVDKRLRYLMYTEANIAKAKDMSNMWSQRVRSLERARRWIKDNTLEIMNANRDIPYKGTIGGFRISKNAVPSLKFDAIPDEYMKEDIKLVINREKLINDLQHGVTIPGVSYEKGEHLRFTLG